MSFEMFRLEDSTRVFTDADDVDQCNVANILKHDYRAKYRETMYNTREVRYIRLTKESSRFHNFVGYIRKGTS